MLYCRDNFCRGVVVSWRRTEFGSACIYGFGKLSVIEHSVRS